jgi:hypothetical protein
MCSMNFFNSLPTEILENEILPWLSPPGVAALILAAGLSVSTRPVVWIRWKCIWRNHQNEVTLTAGSRTPRDARVIRSLGHSPTVTNPEDEMYLHLTLGTSTPTPGWNVDSYVMATALTPMNPAAALSLPWGSLTPRMIELGQLARGEVPLEDDLLSWMAGNAGSTSAWYDRVDERAMLDYFERGTPRTVSERESRQYLETYFNIHPVSSATCLERLISKGVSVRDSWNFAPAHVYRRALSSGYIWSVRDRFAYVRLDLDRWLELVEDFVPRIARCGTYVECDTLFYHHSTVFGGRLAGFVKLLGDEAVFRHVAGISSEWPAVRLRAIIGDSRLIELATAAGMPGVELYVKSGASYYPFTYIHACERYFVARYAIHYENVEFFRGLLNNNPDEIAQYHVWIYGECLKSGSAVMLEVATSCGLRAGARQFTA